MGIKGLGNQENTFGNKFVKALGGDSSGNDAATAAPPGAPPVGLTATGGIISDFASGPAVYRAHIFTSSGTFDVTALATDASLPNTVEYLVVGGGGGGGYTAASYTGGGGGGAGGLRTNLSGHPLAGPAFPVSVSSYTVTVGAGGVGGADGIKGTTGSNSEFHAPSLSYPNAEFIRGAGGGGGGNAGPAYPSPINKGRGGGEGGGSGGGSSWYGPRTGGVAGVADSNHPAVAGNAGGDAHPGSGYAVISSGGGGAGGAGSDGKGPGPGYTPPGPGEGKGGAGAQVLIAHNPTNPAQPIGTSGPDSNGGYFAGGGGGGAYNGPGTGPAFTPSTFTAPPSGGGGSGYMGPGAGEGFDATISTGGGGGGGGAANPFPDAIGGFGGSGIVVVRYQIAELTATAKATGGAISFHGDKTIHTFTSSGTFATKANWSAADVEYVVVGGGGGGGVDAFSDPRGGGGGGAGAYRTGTTPIGAHPVATTIQIGAGGGGGSPNPSSVAGSQGGASYFGTPLTAEGGGFGGGHTAPAPRTPAEPYSGNGSGGGGTSGPGSLGYGGPGGTYGNDGSAGSTPEGDGGGGGGAGGAGGPNNRNTIRDPSDDVGGYGGIGVQLPTSFRDPVSSVGAPGPSGNYWVAGGGGGKGATTGGAGGGPGSPPTGWAGGGPGASSPNPGSVAGTNGLENTGGGGGGGGGPTATTNGGSGGAGIVLIAYPS